MRRALSFALALILLLSLAVPALAADTEAKAATPKLTLSADKGTLSPGQEVKVTLTLDQTLSGLNNYQFNVLYDAARFELTGSTVGAAPTEVSAPREDEQGKGDCITVSGLSTEGQAVSLAAGTVATLTFTALEAAELGEAEFTVSVQALPAYADLSDVALDVQSNAKVTLEEPAAVLLGVVDGNGKITGNDALLIGRYVAKLTTDLDLEAADVDGNGKITGNDALLVGRYVAKLITEFPVSTN
jgi:hypothetical protein